IQNGVARRAAHVVSKPILEHVVLRPSKSESLQRLQVMQTPYQRAHPPIPVLHPPPPVVLAKLGHQERIVTRPCAKDLSRSLRTTLARLARVPIPAGAVGAHGEYGSRQY